MRKAKVALMVSALLYLSSASIALVQASQLRPRDIAMSEIEKRSNYYGLTDKEVEILSDYHNYKYLRKGRNSPEIDKPLDALGDVSLGGMVYGLSKEISIKEVAEEHMIYLEYSFFTKQSNVDLLFSAINKINRESKGEIDFAKFKNTSSNRGDIQKSVIKVNSIINKYDFLDELKRSSQESLKSFVRALDAGWDISKATFLKNPAKYVKGITRVNDAKRTLEQFNFIIESAKNSSKMYGELSGGDYSLSEDNKFRKLNVLSNSIKQVVEEMVKNGDYPEEGLKILEGASFAFNVLEFQKNKNKLLELNELNESPDSVLTYYIDLAKLQVNENMMESLFAIVEGLAGYIGADDYVSALNSLRKTVFTLDNARLATHEERLKKYFDRLRRANKIYEDDVIALREVYARGVDDLGFHIKSEVADKRKINNLNSLKFIDSDGENNYFRESDTDIPYLTGYFPLLKQYNNLLEVNKNYYEKYKDLSVGKAKAEIAGDSGFNIEIYKKVKRELSITEIKLNNLYSQLTDVYRVDKNNLGKYGTIGDVEHRIYVSEKIAEYKRLLAKDRLDDKPTSKPTNEFSGKPGETVVGEVEIEGPAEPAQPVTDPALAERIKVASSQFRQLMANNKVLFDNYKGLRLTEEKADWHLTTTLSNTKKQELANAKLKLDDNASALRQQRVVLQSLLSSAEYEKLPLHYSSGGNTLKRYLAHHLKEYKDEVRQNIDEKVAAQTSIVATTLLEAQKKEASYKNKVKETTNSINKLISELKANNFRPTAENKAGIAQARVKLDKWKADVEAAQQFADNLYIKHHLVKSNLEKLKLEQRYYSGELDKAGYEREKSGLALVYMDAKAKKVQSGTFESSYNKLMDILGLPVVAPSTSALTGMIIAHGGAMGYAEAPADKDLQTTGQRNVVLQTKFDGLGMQVDSLQTGDDEHFNGYQYTAIGKWQNPESNNNRLRDGSNAGRFVREGYWVLGKQATDLPQQGSANFLGEAYGHRLLNNRELKGEVGLRADFGNKTVGGKLRLRYATDNQLFADVAFANAKIGATPKPLTAYSSVDFGSYFGATLKNADGTLLPSNKHTDNYVVGSFYGDGAKEVGGTWQISKGHAAGVFRAKQTTRQSELIPKSSTEIVAPTGDSNYRGVFSMIGTAPSGHEISGYSYAEAPAGADLKTAGKRNVTLITNFGDDGMVREDLTTSDKDHFNGYNHIAMGRWASKGNQFQEKLTKVDRIEVVSAEKGFWLLGETSKELPKIGSAGYLGEVHGLTSSAEVLHGDIGLKADFRANKVAGKMLIRQNDGSEYMRTQFSNADIGLDKTRVNIPTEFVNKDMSQFFAADLVSDNGGFFGGNLAGGFYGLKGEEIGGGWKIRKPRSGAAGVFRAKQVNGSHKLIPDNPSEELPHWQGFHSFASQNKNIDSSHLFYITNIRDIESHAPIINGKITITDSRSRDSYQPNVNFGDYQYVAWGEWGQTYPKKKIFRQVVYGNRTSSQKVPKIGSATYAGSLVGDYLDGTTDTFEQGSITGSVNLEADFKKNQMSGTMNMQRRGNVWATLQMTTDSQDRFRSGHYTGDITSSESTSARGRFIGAFYGPNAEETGGGFNIDKGSEHVSGTYRAKRQ